MLIATGAGADIFGWQDAEGVQHYTNLKDEVPRAQVVQTVVDERARQPQQSSSPAAEAEAAESAPAPEPAPAKADDSSGVARAYQQGLESGLARAGNTGGDVYVSVPLAVTVLAPAPYGGNILPGYYGYYGWLPGYYPFMAGYVPLGPAAFKRHRMDRHDGRMTPRQHFGTDFQGPLLSPGEFLSAAGPPPLNAVGPPPLGAVGPPPLGAAGPPPRGQMVSRQ
jgi:hypothetical protein